MKKILVTGGAGFIGSNFIYYMLGKHEELSIVCLDSLTYAGNLATLEPLIRHSSRFKFIKGDITDRSMVYRLFDSEQFDCVVNFAAESHVDRSIDTPEVFLRTNIIGTSVLLDAFNKFGISRFHQISTDEVYGDLPLDRPELFFTEKTPLHTSSPYSASKAAADLLVMSYVRTYGTPATISRCSNNYGPYHFPEKLIPLLIVNALADRKVPVYGAGENVRDWIYVEDHCRAVDLILEKGQIGEIYNIGGHEEHTNLEVVRKVLAALGKGEELIEFVEDRPGHDRRYAIDASKLKREVGWEPLFSFDEGIEKTVKWYLENREWWQNILSGEYLNNYRRIIGY